MKNLRKQKEFDNLRTHGKRYKQKYLDIVVAYPDENSKIEKDDFGLAVITGKIIGNAVKRNKVRRWIKEWFRQTDFSIRPALNYLVITKKGIYKSGRKAIIKELKNALEKIKHNFK